MNIFYIIFNEFCFSYSYVFLCKEAEETKKVRKNSKKFNMLSKFTRKNNHCQIGTNSIFMQHINYRNKDVISKGKTIQQHNK